MSMSSSLNETVIFASFKTIKDEVNFLWEEITESVALLIGMTVIWFLVEVMEYTFVGLLCHISMSLILIIYIRIWVVTNFYWDPLNILRLTYFEARFRELIAHIFCSRFDFVLGEFLGIAHGQNPALLILANSSLYILSIIESYFSSLSLLYLGFLCIETLYFLDKRYWKLQPRRPIAE